MRIGIDLRLPYYQMGGISQYALHLLPSLAAIDTKNQYVIVQSRKDKRLLSPPQANFIERFAWTPCHHRFEKYTLAAEISRLNVDVWHTPDFIPPAFGAKRRVITVHDLNFLYYPHFLTAESRRYYNDQISWAAQTADVISADSEHTRLDLIDKLGVEPNKVKTIYLAANPIYQKQYRDEAIEETLRKYDLSAGYILFVGTIEPRKNISTLLSAYHQLRQRGITVPLVLVGRKGWLADDIFAQINQLQLNNYVRHLTGVFDERLAHLYHRAALLALPSHYEGFGLPPLEAMHCGCPVVTSNRGSLPEIVGKAGILLDADDTAAWVNSLEHLLNDQTQRHQMIASGYVQAKRFNWQKTAIQTQALYTM